MGKRDVLFLGGLGAPLLVYGPWFCILKYRGYRIHTVPNSFLTWDPVTEYAENMIRLSSRFDEVDVLGVSYGGNAALYGAYLSPEFCARVRKMIVVCAPLTGAPGLLNRARPVLPRSMSKTLGEMAKDSEVVNCIKKLDEPGRIPFEVHYVFHERDYIAPADAATLPNLGTKHKLDFQMKALPKLVMHQAASVNPRTMQKIIQILKEP